MLTIQSIYQEYSPAYDDYPAGRTWPGRFENYAQAWAAVRAYLTQEQYWHGSEQELCPYGHDEPLAFYGDVTIHNDAETILIRPAK